MRGNLARLLTAMILLLSVLASGGCGGGNDGAYSQPENGNEDLLPPAPHSRTLRLFIDGREYRATLNDTGASREFAALLPLDMEMGDHLRREKVARLPQAISIADAPVKPFEAGDIAYWAPGEDLAIFYTSEGSSSVSGLYLLGTLSGGFEALENAGAPVRVRIELAE